MKKLQAYLSGIFYIIAFFVCICKMTLLKPFAWISYVLYFVNTYILIYSQYRKTKDFKKAIKRYIDDVMVTTLPITIYIIFKVIRILFL